MSNIAFTCFVAHGVRLAFLVAHDQIGIHLFHFLGDKAKLRGALGSISFL